MAGSPEHPDDFERDPLLAQLGALERSLEPTRAREWEDVVAGRRDAEAVKAERGELDSPEDQALYEQLFQPLAEERTEQLVDALAGALAQGSDAPEAPISLAERRARAESSSSSTSSSSSSSSSSSPTRSRAGWIGGVGVLAAAAAVLLWVRPFAGDGGGDAVVDEAMPGYSLVVRNRAVMEKRSAPEATAGAEQGDARYHPSSRIHWVLTPERGVAGEVSVAVLARSDEGSARLLTIDPAALERSPEGAVTLRGRLDELLPLAPGRWTLSVIVGATAAMPDAVPAAEALVNDRSKGTGVVVVRPAYALVIEEEAGG